MLATAGWDATLRCWDPRIPAVGPPSFPPMYLYSFRTGSAVDTGLRALILGFLRSQQLVLQRQSANQPLGRGFLEGFLHKTNCLQGRNCAAHMALPGKAFSMSQASTRLVVATSSRHLLAYDIRRCRVSPHWDICMHCIMQKCILGDSAHTSCCPAKCTDRSGDLPDARRSRHSPGQGP